VHFISRQQLYLPLLKNSTTPVSLRCFVLLFEASQSTGAELYSATKTTSTTL